MLFAVANLNVVVFVGQRFCLGGMNRALRMVLGRVDGIEFHVLGAGIYEVMFGSGRNDYGEIVFDRVLFAVQDRLARTSFDAQELVHVVHFHAYILTGLQAHQDELAVRTGVDDLPEVRVFHRGFLNVINVWFHIIFVFTAL